MTAEPARAGANPSPRAPPRSRHVPSLPHPHTPRAHAGVCRMGMAAEGSATAMTPSRQSTAAGAGANPSPRAPPGANPSPRAPPRIRHVHPHTTRAHAGVCRMGMAAEGRATAMTLLRRHNGQEGPPESECPWSASMLHCRRRGARAERGSGVDDKVLAPLVCICSETSVG